MKMKTMIAVENKIVEGLNANGKLTFKQVGDICYRPWHRGFAALALKNLVADGKVKRLRGGYYHLVN